MSATTFDRPAPRVRVVPDNVDNRIGYSSLLAARDALTVKVRSVGTVIASAQGSALRQARMRLASAGCGIWTKRRRTRS